MKKIFLSALLITLSALFVFAQGTALIKLESTGNFRVAFRERSEVVARLFKFNQSRSLSKNE